MKAILLDGSQENDKTGERVRAALESASQSVWRAKVVEASALFGKCQMTQVI